jgi:hypothetical protein
MLEGKTPVELDGYSDEDLLKWHKCFKDTEGRRVALTVVGKVTVSTMFLGVDYGWGDKRLLFETMVFGGDDDHCERYSTWDEALEGHNKTVEMLK